MGSREQQLQRLKRRGSFDLLVVGGGITGTSVARDAAHRGLSVLLVEKSDLASGTSSRSSKLVHGGLRYLEQLEFGLVFESVNERRTYQRIAPHLVRPLPFLFPLYRGRRPHPFVLEAGMWLYEGLSFFRSPGRHRFLGRAAALRAEPALAPGGLRAGVLYYDCAVDDARLALETALDAEARGAVIATYCEARGLERRPAGFAVRLHDALSGEELEVEARGLVLAAGPWTDRLRAELGLGERPVLRPTRGIHLVFEREALPVRRAVVMVHPRDGRVMFAIPWGSHTYAGTTDTDDREPERPAATAEDVAYVLEAVEAAFPAHAPGPEQVIATWAGLRPLLGQEGVSESEVSREHAIREEGGAVYVAGGKLTTARLMGQQVVDCLLRSLDRAGRPLRPQREADTAHEPLPGAVGWPGLAEPAEVARDWSERARHLPPAALPPLFATYGNRAVELLERVAERPELAEPLAPPRPELAVQVEQGVLEEYAARLEDVMLRRLPLFYKAPDQGLPAAQAVARRMAGLLGWDEARLEAELAAYRETVELSRAWREGT